jgi:hypothetical protein
MVQLGCQRPITTRLIHPAFATLEFGSTDYCTEVYRSVLYTGRFIMFSVITNIYNKKTKGPTLMELFTATGKLNFFLDN